MMKRISLLLMLAAYVSAPLSTCADTPKVVITTNFGDIGLELLPEQAPITVENFLDYVSSGFYDGLLFHRVVEDFMIQGGGYFVYDNTIYETATNDPIICESYNGLQNLRGTIAMARTTEPNSATSQFFINHVDNDFLDRENASDGIGYAVFGRVISGLDVVDSIAVTPVANIGYGFTHFPYPDLVWIVEASIAPPGYWLTGDLDNSGQVDFRDFALFTAAYNLADPMADLDENETVDPRDIAEFARNWAQTASWRQ